MKIPIKSKPLHECCLILKKISHETQLDLSWNDLGFLPPEDLSQLFNAIPDQIKVLDLSRNNFSNHTDGQLDAVLKHLPSHLSTLILSKNNIGEYPTNLLIQAFSLVRAPIKVMDLSFCGLQKKSPKALTQIVAALPISITTLNFRGNYLGKKETSALVSIMLAMPEGIVNLNLGRHNFGSKSAEELSVFFSKIPRHIKKVSFSQNNFHQVPYKSLVQAFSCLPSHINTCSIAGNRLFTDSKRTDALLCALKHTNGERTLVTAGNGESDFSRAICPMIALMNQKKMPYSLFCQILTYLSSPPKQATITTYDWIQSRIIRSLNKSILFNRYLKNGGSYFRSALFFKEKDVIAVVEVLKKRGQKNSEGASQKTLHHFGLR